MFRILIIILKRRKYLSIAIIATILMSAITYYLTIINVYHSSIFIYADMNGAIFTISSLILGLIIAVLFGSYISLLFFRSDVVKARAVGNKSASLGGTVSGIIASGCPSCGSPILGLVGLPLGLFSLPFRGIEIKILSIALLILSIYLISKNIQKNLACQTNPASK